MVVNSLMSRKRPEGLYHTAQDYFHKVGNVLGSQGVRSN